MYANYCAHAFVEHFISCFVLYTYSCNMWKNNMMHKCNTTQIRVNFLIIISQNRKFKPLGKNEVGGHA